MTILIGGLMVKSSRTELTGAVEPGFSVTRIFCEGLSQIVVSSMGGSGDPGIT